VEREIGADAPWRDVFVNVRTFRPVQVRAGQFKMPFSLEQLTSPTHLDFVYRSRAADLLAPGRGVGASLHGRLAARTLGYDVGLFRRDGETARFGSNPGAGQTVAARLTVRPPEAARHAGSLGDIEVGVNATSGDVSEGRHSLRGRLTSRSVFFAPVYVQGRRMRLGADLDWRPGPFGVRAEIIKVEDERRDQGLDGTTLSPLRSDGWYIAGTWAVAGRRAAKQAAAADWFAGWLKGVELAARFERLGFGSVSDGEPALRNPRAATLARMDEQALTFGVNWSLNRWTRIQVNAIREQVTDAARGSVVVPSALWTRVCRLQFSM
jgi:phosphate-selective porin OprO and OprP